MTNSVTEPRTETPQAAEHPAWCDPARCDREAGIHFSAESSLRGIDWTGELFIVQNPGQDASIGLSIDRRDHHSLTSSQAVALAEELLYVASLAGHPEAHDMALAAAGIEGGWTDGGGFQIRLNDLGERRMPPTD